MAIQVITGVLLSFFYVADVSSRFFCVFNITSDSIFTWFIRYIHLWGVSILFVLLFIHMGRSLYYSRYVIKGAWKVGFIIYLLLMVEAFTGYVLPWHQMSYWAATVLTSIVDSVPIIGHTVYTYIVGGFSVTDTTLIRMFSIHVILGFVILGSMILHLAYLHSEGSKNQLFRNRFSDIVYFHSYYTSKDFMVFIWFMLVLVSFIYMNSEFLVDVEGSMEADYMNTPIRIKPEWYFLAYFSILRCISSKMGGILLILSFLFFLYIPTFNQSCVYYVFRQFVFWSIVRMFISLTYLGTCHPEYPYILVCRTFRVLMVVLMFIFKLLWASYDNGLDIKLV